MSRIRPIVVVNFDRYNPPHKAVNKEIRDGGPLKWLRWETIGHRDKDILDLPPTQRFLWWVLCDLAGQQQRTADGLRVIRMTSAQLAREAEMPLADVEAGLRHLWKRERIRYTVQGGARVAKRGRKGGESPPLTHLQGGHVPTDLRTDERTSDAARSGSQDDARRAAFDLVGKAQDIAEKQRTKNGVEAVA